MKNWNSSIVFCLWILSVLTLHVYCLINRTTYTLWKNCKNWFVFLESDISEKCIVLQNRLFIYKKNGYLMKPIWVWHGGNNKKRSHTQLDSRKQVTVIALRGLRIWNPFMIGVRILPHLFFWKIKVIYSPRYITLGWQSKANNWHGFESEIHDFFFIGESMSFIILGLI